MQRSRMRKVLKEWPRGFPSMVAEATGKMRNQTTARRLRRRYARAGR